MKVRFSLTIAAALLVITACGGSGGGSRDRSSNPGPESNPPPLAADEVRVTEGVYKGTIEGELRIFRGLRYAAPPVGQLRFKAPEPLPSFAGTADATQFGSNCFQPANPDPVGEEDCLFLNIWSHNDANTRPVLVFLHGGGGGGIGGDLATSEGSLLARNGDLIVVTLNRRMSILGGLALTELVQESPRSTAGNYQIRDVMAALAWLRSNVAEFNGDPDHIMLVGESAGGGLVCHILAAPDAAGLISAAVIQSGGCGFRTRLDDTIAIDTPFDTALNIHRPVVAAAGCEGAADVPQCLRDLSAEAIHAAGAAAAAAAGRGGIWGPIVDGVVVTSDPHTALKNEVAGNIPIIVGSTADEGGGGFAGAPPADDAEYRARLNGIFGSPRDDQVYALYPPAEFSSLEETWVTFWGDWIFNCVAEELARSASANAPAYLYLFSRGFSSGSRAGQGAVHAIDVPFLFETYDIFGHTPDADDEALTDAMQHAWAGLAAEPTVAPPFLPSGSSSWPAFDPDNIQFVNFDSPVTTETVHREGRCASFREIIPF